MSKPDNRSDNASKIKANIAATKANMEAANEVIAETNNNQMKKDLSEKNERRATSLPEMKRELQEELSYSNQRNQ